MKKVLVTGFDIFGNYTANPSKWLAENVDGDIIAGYEVHSLVIPTTILFSNGDENPGEMVIRKVKEIGANMIISFGMASDLRGFRIEQSAVNWIYNKKYCTEVENNQPLDPSRYERENLSINLALWDIDKMRNVFKERGISLELTISNDAGMYICNALIYRILQAMEDRKVSVPFIFIHTSCTEEAVHGVENFDRSKKMLIKNEDMIKALEIVISSYKN